MPLFTAGVFALPDHPDAVPLVPAGNIGGVQGNNGNTRLYYQGADNSISELAVSGPFISPHSSSTMALVPAAEVLKGTPIAATTVNGTALQEV